MFSRTFSILTTVAIILFFSTTLQAGELHKSEHYTLNVETVVDGLERPWGLAFLPDGSFLVTERPGRIQHVKNGVLSKPVSGVPKVAATGQGGLLDIAISPDFETSKQIFFSFSEPAEDSNLRGTALARARLELTPEPNLQDLKIIFRQNRKTGTSRHFGSRIVFRPDGTLFLTIGDRGDRPSAQDPFDHAGSILRLNPDGSVPADNPYADGKDAAAEIWSIGHRNPQGAGLHPQTKDLWTVEHGARGGDEINRPRQARNYGWPDISFGRHYSGSKIGAGSQKDGLEQPVYYWDPSIAPSGLTFYDSDIFSKWRGNLFVGALKYRMLVRLELADGKVQREERMLEGVFGRIRDVRQGPKGYLYLLTDEPDGKILRLEPVL